MSSFGSCGKSPRHPDMKEDTPLGVFAARLTFGIVPVHKHLPLALKQ